MKRLPLTVCTADHDRERALADGRTGIEGCCVNYVTMNPEQAFCRAWHNQEFDVTELFHPATLDRARIRRT